MEKNVALLESSQDTQDLQLDDEQLGIEDDNLPKVKDLTMDEHKKVYSHEKPKNKDCSIDDQNMDTNSSIHSYDGSTANPSLEELAHCELGETEQIRESSL